MTKKANQGAGISIKVVHAAMLVLGLLLILLLIFSSYKNTNVFTRLNKETGNYIVRQKAAHDLMEASDYLTEMTQRFTLEGDTQYLDKYFEEAFGNQRREAAITSMAENEAEQTLVNQIQEALNESNKLMYREYYAMKLVIDAKEIRDTHEQIRAIELKEEDTFLSADEKMELAQEMVMGPEYYQRKEVIRTNLKASLQTMDKLMTEARQTTSAELQQELMIVRIAIIVLTLVILFLIWLMAHEGTMPLINAQKCAEKGEPIPVNGAREFRYMARHYNRMHEKLYGNKEEQP